MALALRADHFRKKSRISLACRGVRFWRIVLKKSFFDDD
jgi:hypothetical protein